jgi:predicted porin
MAWNHVIIDIGLQYDTHGAPFSDHRPADSGNIVQKNSRESVIGLTPSNIGQSRVGLQGIEPLYGDWSAVFQVETFFNPQSGEIADSLKSLAVNNGRTPSTQTTGLDGRSAGQILCPGLRQQFAWQYQDSAVYWTGVRYSVSPSLDLTVAYYGYLQNAYGTGTLAGCSTSASSLCSGSFEAFSFDVDYHFNKHFDAYLGAMYSGA